MEQNIEQQPITPVSPDGGALENSDKKKSKLPILVIIFAILAIGGIGFGVYELLKPSPACSCPDRVAEKPEEPEKTSPQEAPEPAEQNTNSSSDSNSSPLFSRRTFNNVTNAEKNENYYAEYTSTSGIKIHYVPNLEEDKHEYYFIKCDSGSCKLLKENGEEYATIENFHSKISDYYYNGFGQGYGFEQLFFIMEDGSVEHIPVREAFESKNFKSYGKIEGLNNIIKIHEAVSVWYGYDDNQPHGSGLTALAEDANGNFYDLNKILYPNQY